MEWGDGEYEEVGGREMRKRFVVRVVSVGLLSPMVIVSGVGTAWALPPAEDVPEEILRTQIILDARSPIDGKPLTPAEYAELQAALQAPLEPSTKLSPKVKNLIGLLKLRRFIKRYLPFIPIK